VSIEQKYLAFVLDAGAKQAIRDHFKPRFRRKVCHHITLQFDLTDESFVVLSEEFNDATLSVVGYQAGNGVDCVACSVNGSVRRPDGSIFHVTYSLAPGHGAGESNELLKQQGYQSCIPFRIQGDLQLLNK
jgi:hypothetical protein